MDRNKTRCLIFLSTGLLCCLLAYVLIYVDFKEGTKFSSFPESLPSETKTECCRGIENLKLWGRVLNPGSPLKFGSSNECCDACKAMCNGDNGPCLCDSWVFCGHEEGCRSKFGQCWLKKQKNVFDPDWQGAEDDEDYMFWTSGFIFGRVEAIVKMETNYGALRIKLLPECAPRSFLYIIELLTSSHCIGCQFYRAESRGESWDSDGKHLTMASFGPPFALIQGTLKAEGVTFRKIPSEERSIIERGSVAWIGYGPEFFISLANHEEWKKTYSVFGYVVPDDMEIVEKIASLPTTSKVWNYTNVLVLEKPVLFWFQRIYKATK